MKKLLLILVLVLSTTSCANNQMLSNNNEVNHTIEVTNEKVVDNDKDKSNEASIYSEIYIVALESFMSLDEALNHEMKYIAINNDTLIKATEADVDIVVDYFKMFGVDVINESYKTLKEKDMVIDEFYIEGVLLEIETVEFLSEDKVVVEGSKYKSGLGAIGVKAILIKEDGHWILESADITWIS
jgi:hypothetical protein